MTAACGSKIDSNGVISPSGGGLRSKPSHRMLVVVTVNFDVIYCFSVHNILHET